jgi:hypothetical protein
MGNHQAGDAMGRMAATLIERRKPGETALQLLDVICEPWRGCDAEFESTDPNNSSQVDPRSDDYRWPPLALGMLMIEAFAPNGLADLARYQAIDPESEDDTYYDEVVAPFDQRYDFC